MPVQVVTAVENKSSLHLPRILCLHGGGSNARIFKAQCRKLSAKLESHFRLVFVDGPFLSQAGPCVQSVYADWGPFRRWLRWTPDHPEVNARTAVAEIEDVLMRAMEDDDSKGGTGDWVALLGFSQGAKMSASLLFRQQLYTEKLLQRRQWNKYKKEINFRFAVLLAGRGPLVSLDPDIFMPPAFQDAAAMSVDSYSTERHQREHILQIPTIHVHGTKDPGLELHRRLMKDFCDGNSTSLVVWDGDHRVPLKNKDTRPVVEHIFYLARQTGVLDDIATT
ncbi:hypothetical protein OIDMADRAFT_136692 [Oidiodendron maius Zn]|uniref:Serine hydrolase domain-containing protein n=1 Tax=Oidiodendron maius (strain Zn) TaxID=913774 RepID=A0A0C3CWN8_OIDMZ|nr:hypothetical protein OIDMADRAFT_136692 [Oidiodendron maius Zn]